MLHNARLNMAKCKSRHCVIQGVFALNCMVSWLCVFLFIRNRCKKIRRAIAVGKAYCCSLKTFSAKVKLFWDVKAAKTGALVVVPNANMMCR